MICFATWILDSSRPQTSAKFENDASGGVSESQKRFQLGTQFRDRSSEHSTHNHDIQSTHIEHHHQDNMCIAAMTNEQLINDDEEKMGKENKAETKQSMLDTETEC